MTLKQRRKLLALLEEHTRCEIASRLAPLAFDAWGDIYRKKWEVEDEIRELLYGTHDLVTLGERFGILKPNKKKREERKVSVNPNLDKYRNCL